MKYLVYNMSGKILRTGNCASKDLWLQATEDGEFATGGSANDATQKVVEGKVVDKTPEEIEADTIVVPVVPEEERPADITKGQWQDFQERLAALETEA